MTKKAIPVLFFSAFLLSGCTFPRVTSSVISTSSSSEESSLPTSVSSLVSSETAASVSSNSSSSNASSSQSVPTGVALPDSEGFTAFWDAGTKLSFAFRFSNASLYALSHYGAIDNQKWGDVYFPADLTIKAGSAEISYPQVGVRMKGNTSRVEIADQNGAISGPCHFKLSFKATFDDPIYSESQFQAFKVDWTGKDAERKARKNRTLYDMEKLDLKYLPRNSEKTTSQEMYCYEGFRSSGILAPHDKWASLTLQSDNDTFTGNYEAIEDLDKVFLKRHFSKPEAQGDLYKCVYGPMGKAALSRSGAVEKTIDSATGYSIGQRTANGTIGIEDNYAGYHPCYQLKTNEDTSDFSSMANFINAMWNLRYAQAPESLLTSKLDVEEFLRFEAISYLFGNFDDQRYNYNNYYFYFRPSDGKAIYIPYDWDWSLGNDSGHTMTNLTPFYTTDLSNNTCENNLYWNTILQGSSNSPAYPLTAMRSTYLSQVKNLAKTLLKGENYSAYLTKISASDRSEESSVLSYMSLKSQVVAAFN